MIDRGIKYNNPSELGPWNLIFQGKDIGEEPEEQQDKTTNKNVQQPNNNLLKLPKINQTPADQTTRSNKLTLKLSHHRLELLHQLSQLTNIRPRYGKMNGSILHFYKGNKSVNSGTRHLNFQSKSMEFEKGHSLQRRVSTILVGEPLENEKRERNNRILLNAESAKKRSLQSITKQLTQNKQIMKFYLFQRENRLKNSIQN